MNFNTKICFSVAFLACLHLSSFMHAQNVCSYTLRMKDQFSDGWQGGQLTIRTGADSTTYTIKKTTDSTAVFNVQSGDTLVLRWKPGINAEEVSFQLFDNDNQLVYATTAPGFVSAILYRGRVRCVPCLRPVGVRIENVWDNRVRLRWNAGGTGPFTGWRVITLPQGTPPGVGVGDTLIVTVPRATVNGLSEKTKYDAYVEQLCPGNLSSAQIGPLSFETYWSDDVGITGIVSPVTDCLLSDTVKVLMTNFGANPQSLVRFKYSVNGTDAGVMQPQDGVYTGVLGKDSSAVVAFKTRYNFEKPGEYVITAYTQMGDDDLSNDTFQYYVTTRLVPNYTQAFELWNGGWQARGDENADGRWTWVDAGYNLLRNAPEGDRAWVSRFTTASGKPQISVLESPCFDFSKATTDPHIAFSLLYNNDIFGGGGYLQISDDDGETWKTAGQENVGLNWYNRVNSTLKGPVWAGKSKGWITVKDTLRGMAGKERVRLRFIHYSDGFAKVPAVFAIDQVQVFLPAERDLVALQVETTSDTLFCGLAQDSVRLTFANFGKLPQRLYELAYSVNGGAEWIESVNLDTIYPDQVLTHTFEKPFNSRNGFSEVRARVEASGDANAFNDRTFTTLSHLVAETPFEEDFEAAALPRWSQDARALLTKGHNNKTNVLATRLSPLIRTFSHTVPAMAIRAGDSLFFDYRVVDFSTDSVTDGTKATTLLANTRVEIQISTDCGNKFELLDVISGSTHIPSVRLKTRRIGLTAYAGQDVVLRFKGQQVFGNFWFDLDNLFVGPVGPVSTHVPVLSSAEMRLYPNPARQYVQVEADMQEAAPARLDLTDMMGRVIWTQQFDTNRIATSIDLTTLPGGFYVVRLFSQGKTVVRKMVKAAE